MMLHLKRWLTAPIFPDAEIKTRRASLLNAALLTSAALASIVLVGNVLGGKIPSVLSGADAAAIMICFILRHWMQRGQVSLASAVLIGLDLVGITVFVAYLGTIRTPTAAFYLLIVVGGGLLFDVGGIIATTAASSLAVLGLIVAENAGLLPRPDYTVTITQWITYTALFGLSGGLTFVALQSTRQALARADRQLVVRQRAETALHESEARYRRLVEGSPDIVYIFSDRRGGLYYSPSAESVLGYTRHYLNTHPFVWNESIHPNDQARVARAIQEFAAGQAFDIEYRIRDAQGAWHWLHDRSIGRRVEDGEILIEGLASDITTRKLSEEVLRENEERLRTLSDNLPEAALYRYAHDAQGQPHFEYVSAGIERLTGIAPSDIIGEAAALLRTIAPEDMPRFRQAEAKSRETLAHFEIEVRERHSLTGEVHWVLLRSSPRRQADGSTVWDGVQLNITDRKRAESQREAALEALHESEQKYRNFITQSSEGFTLVDEQGCIIEWNGAREKMTGLTRNQVLGRPFWDVQREMLPPEERTDEVYERRKQLLQDALRTGRSTLFGRTLEAQIMRPDGERRFSQQTVFPIKTDQGYRIGSVSRDVTEQRRTESQREAALEALQQSETLYHTLVETLPLNIFRKDVNGRLTFANTLYCRTQGWSLAEILGKTDYDLHPRELADKYHIDDERVIATGETFETVEEHQPIGGPKTYVQVIKTPLYASDGRVIGIQGAFWDVTDRKQIEDALHESEARYRAVVEDQTETICRFRSDNTYTLVNDVYCRFFGRTRQELLGRQWSPEAVPEDLPLIEAKLRTLSPANPVVVIENRVYSGTGEVRWMQFVNRGFFDAAGQLVEVQAVGRDITDRRQMEEKLQQHTQALSALQATLLDIASPHPLPELLNLVVERAGKLLDSASGGLYICDPERQEVKCVVSYQTRRDFTDVTLHYGEGAAGTVAQTGQPLIIQDYRTWPGRAHIFDADEPFASVLSTPLRWHGQVTGVIHVLRDDERRPFTSDDLELLSLFANHAAIAVDQAHLTASLEQELTERKRAEDALRELNAALEERVAERTRELLDANLRLTELDRLKDEFISRISHELRTPLANIKIYLELLEHGKPEKREPYLRTLHEQANQLQQLIDDLLDVSYLNFGAIDVRGGGLEVNALTRELVTDRTAQAHERDLTLTLAQSPDVPRLTTDRALLRQALGNVLANALNYTPRGGAITLSTAQCVWGGSTWVTIEVRDTGPGIAEKDLPHIFEPFYRGAAASDYKTPGTGVGLTIARRILERLGGRITVDAPPGQGAAFTIWLRAE